jgi:hypothetical protein
VSTRLNSFYPRIPILVSSQLGNASKNARMLRNATTENDLYWFVLTVIGSDLPEDLQYNYYAASSVLR